MSVGDRSGPPPGQTLDRLAGEWRIFQLRRGHRFSADDLLTAWEGAHALLAARTEPNPTPSLCDLGAGIGSVGLLALWRLRQTGSSPALLTVEVQTRSLELQRQTIAWNDLERYVDAHLGDLRSAPVLSGAQRFDLVTGSPPYLPSAVGVISEHPQKAGARFELNGDIFDYCAAAARVLADGGRFVFCHAARDPRPEAAITAAGLVLTSRRDVVFRADQPALIALFTCATAGVRADPAPFLIRDNAGTWTDEYIAMRRDMGTIVWNPSRPGGDACA